MALRAFHVPGMLVVALVLLIITSISVPFLPAMDVVRVHFDNALAMLFDTSIAQIRFGIWSACFYDASNSARKCGPKDHGYIILLGSFASNGQLKSTTIGSSWTRGLAIHPVAAVVTFIACAFSFSQRVLITLVSSFLAAFITLIAFLCDIALYAYVKHKVGSLDNVSADTDTGPAFWLTFISLILLLLSCGTAFFGLHKSRMSDAKSSESYPMTSMGKQLWKRIRRIY